MKHQIIIPKPCSEKWEAMTDVEKGRHCAVCEKTVHDLTNFTKPELLEYLKKNRGICAKIPVDLLDEDIQPKPKKVNTYAATVALAAILSAVPAVGQNKESIQQKEQPKVFRFGEPAIIKKELKEENKTRTIQGQVFSKQDSLPLSGASITASNATQEVFTDVEGKFTIVIPDNQKQDLEVGFTGFISQKVIVTEKEFYTIFLEEEDIIIGEAVIMTGKPVIKKSKKK